MQLQSLPLPNFHALLDKHRPSLAPYHNTYYTLHQHPELSGQEASTAALVTTHLQTLSFDPIHTQLGGHGVAAVLRNGHGPTVLLRADMDALPLEEKTGLPYASKTPNVMHACGHDTHVIAMMAAAETLVAARAHWAGTLVLVFQPAEEQLSGAQAMLDAGLYSKSLVPIPDVVLGQHVMRHKSGTVSVRSGRFLTAADAIEVTIYGRGGHGSAPQSCIDPIVIGAAVVTRLQAVVSREVTPGELAVVSVGAIHAGQSANVIPDECNIKLNVRTYDVATRKRVLAALKRIIRAECEAGGVEKEPLIQFTMSAPPTINDEETVRAIKESFGAYFGGDLVETEPAAASEDFSHLATAVDRPYVMWTYGGVDGKTWDEAVKKGTVNQLPGNHSPFFAPVVEPTIRTGLDAMVVGALTFLGRRGE